MIYGGGAYGSATYGGIAGASNVFVVDVSDTLTPIELANIAINWHVLVSDTVNSAESLVLPRLAVISVQDVISAIEDEKTQVTFKVSVSDAVGSTESLMAQNGKGIISLDTVTINDSLTVETFRFASNNFKAIGEMETINPNGEF